MILQYEYTVNYFTIQMAREEFDIRFFVNSINLKCFRNNSNIVSKVGDPKAPFLIATTPRCKGGRYSFSMDCSSLPLIRTL